MEHSKMSRWALGLLILVSALTYGAEPTEKIHIQVQADVVSAGLKGEGIDASLKRMHEALAPKVKYVSMKKVESKTLELGELPTMVSLPNSKVAEIKLISVKENVATVSIKLPPTEATYSLAKGKSLYLQAGMLAEDDLWLVLSQPK
jgi:hypothetical protein